MSGSSRFNSSILVNTVKEHRVAKAMTQAELAIAIGVSRKTINTIENGVFVPSTILALKLAGIFGVAVEDVFSLASD
jgi:putative transcriptional regulator